MLMNTLPYKVNDNKSKNEIQKNLNNLYTSFY
jgi:hypothetical protein